MSSLSSWWSGKPSGDEGEGEGEGKGKEGEGKGKEGEGSKQEDWVPGLGSK